MSADPICPVFPLAVDKSVNLASEIVGAEWAQKIVVPFALHHSWRVFVVVVTSVTLQHGSPRREMTDHDSMLLRLDIKNKVKARVEEGANFKEACVATGIPIEMALNLTKTDQEFREIYELARENHPPTLSDPAPSSVVYRDPHALKQDFLEMLYDAGLFHKLAQMTAMADPTTEEGQKVLMYMGRSILPPLIPKEQPKQETVVDLQQMSDNELKAMLKEMRAARLDTNE